MKEMDNDQYGEYDSLDEDDLFMKNVVQDDHELLYLDCFLGECYKRKESIDS